MIIVQLAGGLGNQMQQYALYRRFLSLGTPAKLDASWFSAAAQDGVGTRRELELPLFPGLPLELASPEEKRAFTGGDDALSRLARRLGLRREQIFTESEMYHEDLLSRREGYLTGYFACERYYAAILPELRELFAFPEAEDSVSAEKNAAFAESICREREEGITAVSIHIRRGDYLAPENRRLLGGIATPAYYGGAVQSLRGGKPGRLHFYIFSDDPAYARTLHFGEAAEENTVCDWNTGRDSLLDMQLMSLCGVNICANSTFSFWGARLNRGTEKIMIRPSIHKTTQRCIPEVMHELWPGWRLVDPAGRLV